MRTMIIGAGQAGLELAAALRTAGSTDPITLLGAEAHAPYQRPPLSKGYLAGDTADLDLRGAEWFADHGIELVTGCRIESASWNDAAGGQVVDQHGVIREFSSLALATGAVPRKLTVPGADLPQVHYLRTRADADRLSGAITPGTRIAVVGGGFIGLEIAATATAAGARVTVLEAGSRLIGRAVCADTSAFFAGALPRRGIGVLTGVQVSRILGTRQVTGVRFRDDIGAERDLAADLVIVGIGVIPDTSVAEGLGLATDNGILVDSGMRASDGRTIAVGDVAAMPFLFARAGMGRLRLESVPNAGEQARVAAATLTGTAATYRAVPWFWSNQGEIRLQIAGLSHGHDHTVLRGEPGTERFSILYYRNGGLIAADCINQPRDFMAVKKALERGITFDPRLVGDASLALRDLLHAPLTTAG